MTVPSRPADQTSTGILPPELPEIGPEIVTGARSRLSATDRSTDVPERPLRRLVNGLERAVKGLERVAGVMVDFFEGFRGRSWDAAAESSVQAEIAVFDALRSISETEKQQLQPRIAALLRTRLPLLRSAAAVEAVVNRVAVLLGVAVVLVPPVVAASTSPVGWGGIGTFFGELLGISFLATVPARVLWMVTGRLGAALVWLALVLSVYIAAATAIVSGAGTAIRDEGMLVAAVAVLTGLSLVLIGRVYLLAWNTAALWRAWVAQRLEASVVAQLLAVLVLLESTSDARVDAAPPADPEKPYRPLEVTGEVRRRLSSAAAAVERRLPDLLEASPHTPQARGTAHDVALALVELRSAADLPGGRAGDADLARVASALRGWAIGSLADLPLPRQTAEGSAPIGTPSRWATAAQVLRKLLVGVTPIVLLVVVSLLPVTVPTVVTDALGPFAVTWLLISIASVFYPGDVKPDMKSLFGR